MTKGTGTKTTLRGSSSSLTWTKNQAQQEKKICQNCKDSGRLEYIYLKHNTNECKKKGNNKDRENGSDRVNKKEYKNHENAFDAFDKFQKAIKEKTRKSKKRKDKSSLSFSFSNSKCSVIR